MLRTFIRRIPLLGWGLGLFALLAVLTLWSQGSAPRSGGGAPGPTRTPVNLCAGAARHVQDYQAPGQQVPVQVSVVASLASERRPVQPGQWVEYRGEPPCVVGYRFSLANEDRELKWWYTPATGKVEARDDLTKRYSGW